MKKSFTYLIIIVLLIGCSKNEEAYLPKDEKITEEKEVSNINPKNILLMSVVDSLNIENDVHYLSNSFLVKVYNKSIYILDNLKLLIADSQLRNAKLIDFKNIDYRIKGKIVDFSIYGDQLYFIDYSFKIKRINLLDLNIKTIDLQSFCSRNEISSQLFSKIEVVNDTSIIVSHKILNFYKYLELSEWELAYNINPDNSNINAIYSVGAENLDTLIWNNVTYDDVFINNICDRIILSFKGSKKILDFSQDGKLESVYQLETDDDYYKIPKLSSVREVLHNGKKIFYQSTNASILKNNYFGVNSGKVFYLKYYNNKSPSLIICNNDFELENEIPIKGIERGKVYSLFVSNGLMYLALPPQIYILRLMNE